MTPMSQLMQVLQTAAPASPNTGAGGENAPATGLAELFGKLLDVAVDRDGRRVGQGADRRAREPARDPFQQLEPGGLDAVATVMNSVQIFTNAESLGGVESLIGHPATMSHSSVPADKREAMGIPENLIRLSLGIEAIDDLIADLEQAFEKMG